MVKDYMGIILLNEDYKNIRGLTRTRPLASIPIAGRYRIIDFVLSNMVNSGIRNIGIFTKGNSRSLIDHVGSGKPWDLDRKINGLFVFNFGIFSSLINDISMLEENMEFLYQSKQSNVIISSSYMVANMNYEEAIKYHEESGKDITIIYKKVENGTRSFIDCDVLNLDENDNVLSVGKNIGMDDKNSIGMEMFIMKKEILINIISMCIKTGYYNSIKDSIYKNLKEFEVNAYEFTGHLECINSIDSYYTANMNMLDLKINKELFFNNGLIYTKVKDEPPTKYSNNSKVTNSLIANGCVIDGTLENCIIARRVTVHKGAALKNCIILQNCEIKENAKLSNIIIDKNVFIEKGTELKGAPKIPLIIEKKGLI